MKEGFYRSEFVPPEERKEEKYAHLEAEQDFLAMLDELRRKKQIDINRFPAESHGRRGRDRDHRELWRGEKKEIEKIKSKKKEPVAESLMARKSKTPAQKELAGIIAEPHQSILDDFLKLLREKGIRVSTPEWLQFITVIGKKAKLNELTELVENNELLNKFRLYAKTILIKDKADEAVFHEAFDEYFELIAKVFKYELNQVSAREEDMKNLRGNDFDKEHLTKKELQQITDELTKHYNEKESCDSGVEPELKENLGIQEVKENLSENEEHEDTEEVHGGKKDQHNDILKKEDLSKQGGGDKKEGPSGEGDKGLPSEGKGDKGKAGQGQGDKGREGQGKGDKGEAGAGKGDKGQPSGMGRGSSRLKTENQIGDSSEISEAPQNIQQEKTEHGYLVGGGKGKSVFAERVQRDSIYEGEKLDKQVIREREKRVGKIDRRLRYEERPDKASMREVIRNIRRIILDVSEVKSSNVDLKRTVRNFARRDFRFDYEREREKQPEIVLLIDVGGPVDEWSPLVKEVAEAMAEGLTKLEIYLFHNNLYGYVWKPDPKDLLASSYAKPNSLIDIKSIIKKRKKVIIYGDAEMSYSEFEDDGWPPSGNDERVEKFGMGGEECLNFIKKKADSVVWISPIFQKEWEDRDDSGTIQAVSGVIPMHDLTVGGVEDAIKDLMKK